tara:strand:- start:3600 stop:3929 length:330 start_codon:yes stop_codon:yes gene_type:complete
MTFFNTINEQPSELAVSIAKAKSQEEKIMKCIYYYESKYTNLSFSPSMVLNMTNLKCPLTSIRRAMTNLSNEGKLIKTNNKIKGMYGKQEHLWSLPKKQESFSQSTLPF